MRKDWQQLYAVQDWVLDRLKAVDHRFYLTGGTALARGYYHHRYSEDLDLFVNDAREFQLWRDRCLKALADAAPNSGWRLEIVLREERFGRAVLHGSLPLKLEFVNDVPFRVGQPWNHPRLGRLDTKENILANKVSALVDRQEPKDLVDIYFLCCLDNLDLVEAIEHAQGKAAGLFPPVVAAALQEGLNLGLPRLPWRRPPDESLFRRGIQSLISRIMSA
jgi:hypothetical protein